MRQHFILAHQRGSGDLRQHKSRIEAGAGGEKRRQTFIQRWIDEALKPPLGNSRERAERDAKEIEHERYGLAVEISAREDLAVGCSRASSVRAPITSAESTSVSAPISARTPSASIPCVPLISETASLASSTSGLIWARRRASALAMRMLFSSRHSPSPIIDSAR